MSNLNIQVRFYNSDLSFRKTVEFQNATPTHVEVVCAMICMEQLTKTAADNRMPANFCNLMVREDGKLVSFRKFVK